VLLRQFKLAGEDFMAAFERTKNAKYLDAAVYSQIESGEDEDAIGKAKFLLTLDYDSAALRNNLGLAYSRLGLLPDALEEFKAATEMRPSLALAWRNLAWCRFSIHFRNSTIVPNEAVTDIEFGLQSCGAPSAELYFDAACILARTEDARSRLSRIFEHLRAAIECGLDPGRLSSGVFPQWLRDEPDFVELTGSSRSESKQSPPRFLIDPLEDVGPNRDLRATAEQKKSLRK
jgi:tetratricopeptide (TPR) repeat protein